ncbi:MAG: type I-MYXAN CRISPR-associated Cas8a1/Cmx1 [Gammaproteobacteria bacterium]
MADMILKLNGPGMTSLHKAGLAGLYMTLKAFDRNKTTIDGLDWTLCSDRVILKWMSATPKDAFQRLIEQSFQIDNNGFFHFAGLHYGGTTTKDHKHLFYKAMLNTFLQYGKHSKKDTARPLIFQVDEKTKIYDADFKPITSYQHQHAADDFLGRSGAFRTDVEVIGWLYPGGGQRHAIHSNSVLTEPVEKALCLLYAPVGCVYFQISSHTKGSMARAALVIPEILDLREYAALREYIARNGALALTASGASDAVLRFIAAMRAAALGNELARMSGRNGPCRVVTFGLVKWVKGGQKVRTMTRTVFPETLKGIGNYALADAIFKNDWQRVKEKRDRRGEVTEPEHHFIKTSAARELIADNIARGGQWYDGFADYMANKEARTQLIYERKELSDMVNQATFDDARERIFISACHEAWRRKLGKLGERARRENAAFSSLVNREYEKLRVSLSRCKNPATLRETVVDFWSRAGSIKELHDHWQDVLSLLDEKNWRKGKDLALLALASYKPASKDEEHGMAIQTTEATEGEGNE